MAERRTESPRTLLQSWPDRTGLPAALVAKLPAVAALFAVEGQPAFGVAVLSAMSGSGRAALKMRAFEAAVEDALRDLGFRLDLGPAGGTAVEELAARVELLTGTLSPAQIDQLGVLFEDYMRSSDAEWLEMVLRAVRGVVKDAVDEGTRRAVIARLPALSIGHLRELARLRDRPERTRSRLGARPREATPMQSALLHVGFVREAPAGEATEPVPRAVDTRADVELRPTTLGLAALRVLGPIEAGEGR